MGCDVHAHFEIKVDGEWLHYSQPNIKRNYRLFARMAGVRGHVGDYVISNPLGTPYDVSKTTRLEKEWLGDDGHSHSYFNADEIKELIEFHESLVEPKERVFLFIDQWGYLCGNGWEGFKEYPESYPKEIEDIRLVFWFDN